MRKKQILRDSTEKTLTGKSINPVGLNLESRDEKGATY